MKNVKTPLTKQLEPDPPLVAAPRATNKDGAGSGGIAIRFPRRLSADFAGRKRPPKLREGQVARGVNTFAAVLLCGMRGLPQSSDCVR